MRDNLARGLGFHPTGLGSERSLLEHPRRSLARLGMTSQILEALTKNFQIPVEIADHAYHQKLHKTQKLIVFGIALGSPSDRGGANLAAQRPHRMPAIVEYARVTQRCPQQRYLQQADNTANGLWYLRIAQCMLEQHAYQVDPFDHIGRQGHGADKAELLQLGIDQFEDIERLYPGTRIERPELGLAVHQLPLQRRKDLVHQRLGHGHGLARGRKQRRARQIPADFGWHRRCLRQRVGEFVSHLACWQCLRHMGRWHHHRRPGGRRFRLRKYRQALFVEKSELIHDELRKQPRKQHS